MAKRAWLIGIVGGSGSGKTSIAQELVRRLQNEGVEPLRVLCVCSPPYSHQDTELA